MPHRTVFQWGRNHAHPFTMFVGGFVVGTLVTGTAVWAWTLADEADVNVEDNVGTPSKQTNTSATSSPSPSVVPSASPAVTF